MIWSYVKETTSHLQNKQHPISEINKPTGGAHIMQQALNSLNKITKWVYISGHKVKSVDEFNKPTKL